jgi:hypothetical protein
MLGRVSCPTLIVRGTESDVLSEAQARRIVQALPRGELIAVPGSGRRRLLPAFDRFLEIRKASGISSAGAARQSVVSGIAAAHSARGDALNFPARAAFRFRAANVGEKAIGLAASRSTTPGLVVLSLTPRELPARRFVIGAAALDQAHRGEDAAVEGTAHRGPLLVDGATPLS